VEADDFALMERVQAGGAGAFETLVERYQRRLYRLACGYLHDHEDALDAVQETFVRLYLARASYRPNAHPFTWVSRILANHCIDQIRRRRARPEAPLPEAWEERPDASATAPRSPDETPEARQERRELRSRLQGAIDALPRRQREIFMLRHFGEMRLEEIAASLGCALGTVKSSLHRAASAIRDRLERADAAQPAPGKEAS